MSSAISEWRDQSHLNSIKEIYLNAYDRQKNVRVCVGAAHVAPYAYMIRRSLDRAGKPHATVDISEETLGHQYHKDLPEPVRKGMQETEHEIREMKRQILNR
jgi:hypothetical protein